MRRGVSGLAIAAGLLVAACGSSTASRSIEPSPSGSAVAAPPIAIPSTTAAASPAPLPSGVTATTRDPTLLAILPSSVGGIAVTEEPESFAQAVTDPAFVANVDRAAFPLAVGGQDLASGVVAHLRPAVFSDAMFSDWRATYDNGACAQSGNVLAHAQEESNGRTTYVTTCAGGLRVYHSYVASQGVIVSLLSSGPADLGGQMMRGLKG